MTDIITVAAERTNLDLHVDLCAQRYTLLEKRLESVEAKVDAVSESIRRSSQSMRTVVITSAGTVVASVLGLITVILMKF